MSRHFSASPEIYHREARELLRRLAVTGGRLRQGEEGWHLISPRRRAGRPPACLDHQLVARMIEEGVLIRQGAGEAVAVPGGGRPVLDDSESPLVRLHLRKGPEGRPVIDGLQFAAGERLRQDFERAQLSPRVTARWDAPTGGPGPRVISDNHLASLADGAIAARQRLHAAFESVGPELSGVLYHVCCLAGGLENAERLLALPQRSGKAVLALALTRLARHYGLVQKPRPIGTGDIGHWAVAGYRPTLVPR